MAGLEEGMVCVKTHGRQAGKKVIVLHFDKKAGMALVEGPFVKKRKCNIRHLLPTGKSASVGEFSYKVPKKNREAKQKKRPELPKKEKKDKGAK